MKWGIDWLRRRDELVMAVGIIEPSYLCGWSGGRKALMPGLAHHESIDNNHYHLTQPGAEPDELWPPSHGFKDITIAGVTDPDGDPVASVITSIFQDEAVDARGSGHTSPDGTGVGTPTARVRSERTGRGDGRVYHIGFGADDGQGGQCSGEVTVCVPHDQRPNHFCVDQGALYDSTQQFVKPGNNRRRR